MPFQDFTRRLQGPPQPLTLPEYDLPTQIEPMDEHQAAVEKIFGKSQPNFAVDVPDNWNVEEQKPQAQPGKPPKYQTLRDLMPKQQRKAKTISARKPGAKTGTMPGTVTARNPLTGSAFDPRPKANNEFDLSLGGPSEAEQMVERALVASGQNVGRDTSRKRSFLQKVQDQQAQDIRSQRLRLEGVDTGETKFDPASLERTGELLRMRKQVESENPLIRFGRRFLTTAAGGLKPDEEFINAPVNRAEDAVNSLMDAATRGIASMPEGFARVADNFLNQGDIAAASAMQKILANHPDMTPAEKTEAQAKINKLHSGLSKMGDYIEPISKMGDEASKGLYPRDPNAEETINPLKADFWSHTMPQAAGSMLPFMAASGVGGALKIAPELVAGGAGMAMEVPDQYHEARAAGATPEQLARSVDTGMLAGGLESMGAESLMGKVGLTGKSIPGHVAKEALQEFGQEGAQSLVEDLGAKYYSGHKPELTAGQITMNALQNAVPALFLGAGGGAMGVPAHLAERNHQKIAEQIEQVATTQPDHPVAQTIAAVGIDPTTVSKADDKAIEQLSIRFEAMAKMDSQIQQLQGQQTQVQQQVLNAQQAQQMGRVPSTVEAQAVQQAPVVEQQLAEAEAQQAAIVQDLQQNVSPLFKNLAKAIGKSEAQPISDVADDPKANLLTEVRRAGGISAGEGTVEKGELDRLGIKEAGTTGIISRTGGESADRMRERMASEGLTEAETPQQFIGELEAATKKGKTEAESYADYQRSQMTEQEIADSDKLDEVLADKTHPFTQIYRTLDNPKTIFTKDLAKKFDAAAQQAGFSDDFIERSLVEFQNQRATNPNAKVVEKNLPDSEPGRSMKPAEPGTSVSMSPYKVLEANNKELLQKLHKTNLNSKEGVAGVNQLRDWARANGIEQRHVGAWISDIQNWQKKYGVPENPDAQSSATRAPLGTEVKAPQPARKEAAPASPSPSGFSQEQRKLLGTDHTNLLDSEFDEYMKKIENLQNMSVRGKEFGGFDINEAERKGLVSKLIEIRKERKARVKAKRLPALTAPHTKATAPKAELGEQLVEQAAERETTEVPRETVNVSQRAEIDQAAHEAATSPRNELPEPTEAQIEAGNYKKGHISIHGLDVTIENPKGSTRSGVGEGGQKWSVEMSAHYGYVKRTEGADGEQIDVYIGDKPESSKAFVVDQVDPKTGKFDEHKVILGVESQTEAEKLYDAHFDDKSGPSRRQSVTEMSVDGFKDWLKTEDNTKPVSEKSQTQASETANNRVLGVGDRVKTIESGKEAIISHVGFHPNGDRLVNLVDDNGRSVLRGVKMERLIPIGASTSEAESEKPAELRPLPEKNSTKRIDGVLHSSVAAERVGGLDFELWENESTGSYLMRTVDESGDVVEGSSVEDRNERSAKQRFKDKIENARQALGEQSDGQVATAKPVVSGETAGSAAVAESGEAEGKRDASTAFPDTRLGRIAQQLADGKSLTNIQAVRKQFDTKIGTEAAKKLEEDIEFAGVLAAREIVGKGLSTKETYDALLDLHNRMPNLNTRTSESVRDQAYSTPLPIAYVASRLAGITQKTTVYEPTGGNGALVMEASPDNTTINDLNPQRVENLRAQGFEANKADATKVSLGAKVDVVIANPPFGVVKENGQSKQFETPFGKTTEIDHAIVFKALEAMADDGKAVLIVGGVNRMATTRQARSDAYNQSAKRKFYPNLYDNYNVTDHFTIDGQMYAKQGAAWPVDVIVIDGRGKSARQYPAVDVPEIVRSYEELGAKISEGKVLDSTERQQSVGSGKGTAARPGRLPGFDDSETSGSTKTGRKSRSSDGGRAKQPATSERPSGERTEPVVRRSAIQESAESATPKRTESQSETAKAGSGVSETTVRENKPASVGERTDSGTGRTSELDQMFEEEFADMFGESPKEAQPKREKSPTQTTQTAKVRTETTAKPATKPSLKQSADALMDLFGDKPAKSGPPASRKAPGFDESLYQKAKPQFEAALSSFEGLDDRAAIRELLNYLKSNYGERAETAIYRMKPYIIQFVEDRATPTETKPEAKVEPRQKQVISEQSESSHAAYEPLSTARSLNVAIPKNMSGAVKAALANFEERHGSPDKYVAEKLGYKPEEIEKYFSAEQVDALSLAVDNIEQGKGFVIGDQCVAAGTKIYDPLTNTHTAIEVLAKRNQPIVVLALTATGLLPVLASAPFRKGEAQLYRVVLDDGRKITVTAHHRFLTPDGWSSIGAGLHVGHFLASAEGRPACNLEFSPSIHVEDAQRLTKKPQDCLGGCYRDKHQYDEQLQSEEGIGQAFLPLQADVLGHSLPLLQMDDLAVLEECSHQHQSFDRHSKSNFSPLGSHDLSSISVQAFAYGDLLLERTRQSGLRFPELKAWLRQLSVLTFPSLQEQTETGLQQQFSDSVQVSSSLGDYTGWRRIESIEFIGVEAFYDLWVPGHENYVAEGLIHHNTGIGKGRINAGIIRYAIKNGKTPVFVTQKPALYADMIRDLKDIGMESIRPLITNSGESIPLNDVATEWMHAAVDAKAKGEKVPKLPSDAKIFRAKPDHVATLEQVGMSGKLKGYDVVFTTYDQMNPMGGLFNKERHAAVSSAVRGGVLIMDESHTAGGVAPAGRGGKPMPSRSKFFRGLVNAAGSVFYSSATYAKRPDVMDLYSKTDLGLLGKNGDALTELFGKGGVALQQVVASKLAEAGQYLRRERTFDGITYSPEVVEVNKQHAENVSTTMRMIVGFDNAKRKAVADLKENVKASAAIASEDGSIGSAGVDSSNFTSLMHNVIDQMLLGLKADQAAAQAIKAIQNGERPVLTVSNTMESFLKDAGLSPGDAVDLSFKDVLMRYLQRSRDIVIKDRDGNKERRPLTDDELGGKGLAAFEAVQDFINESDFGDIPISPIDRVRELIEKAGYKVDEITGRGTRVDSTTGAVPILRARSAQDTKVAGRRRVIGDFNNGRIDALILNQAGSTGISLHASPAGGKDVKPRHMIIWQAEKNIDTHMQMLGRVNRTGQVTLPRYTQMIADVPAEKRPAAVLLKKMASLSANTTASRKSAVQTEGVTDFINELGDKVVARILTNDTELSNKLGDPLDYDGDELTDTGAARKVSGRIPLLTLAEQHEVYERIESEYADYLAQKEAMGENPLEARTEDFKAETISKEVLTEGVPGSPFSEPAYLEKVKINRTVKPYTSAEVAKMVREGLELSETASESDVRQTAGAKISRFVEENREPYQNYKKSLTEGIAPDDAKGQASALGQVQKAITTANHWSTVARVAIPGAMVTVNTDAGSVSGVVLDVLKRGKPKNPYALGSWVVRLAVLDGRELRLSFNEMINKDGVLKVGQSPEVNRLNPETGMFESRPMLPEFDASQGTKKQTRYMVTGNIVSGYAALPKGQILNYTDSEGNVKQGVLLPANFDAAKTMAEMPVELSTASQVIDFFDKVPRGSVSDAKQEITILPEKYGTDLEIRVLSAKSIGGKYYLDKDLTAITGNFVKQGGLMKVNIDRAKLPAVMSWLKEQGIGLNASHKAEAKEMLGQSRKAPPASRRTRESVESSPEFKKWFGQSKVVDASGKPMPLYHGTQARNEIEAVDPSRFLTGSHFGPGFYMAESPEIASKGYAEGHLHPRGQESAGTPSVYKLYAKIENPLDVNKPAEPKMIAAAFGSPNVDLEEMGFGSRPTNEVMYKQLAKRLGDDKAAVNQKLQEMGYDGITRLNRASDESPEHREWVVFDPRQVKSATGNRGTFDESANLSTSRRTEGGPASKLANPMDVLLYQQSIVKDRGSRGARMYVNDHARAILGASLTEVFGDDYSNVNAINLSREEVKKVADYLATEAKGLEGNYKAGADGFVADLRELLSKNKTQRTFNIVDVSAYEARHESGIRSDQERAAENLKGDIREEGFHWSQREVSGQTVALVGSSWAQSSKGFGKYRRKLIELGYPDDAETLAAETAAKIAAGKFDDLGIRTEADHEQAQNWLASYFERVAEKHGIEALEKFDRLLPKAKEAKAKGAESVKERLRERIEQEQAQSGGTNRPRAPGGESQRVRGADEGRQENGTTKVRSQSEGTADSGSQTNQTDSGRGGVGKPPIDDNWGTPFDGEPQQPALFDEKGLPRKDWGDMWANLADVLNLPKALRASGDLSAAGRQGWFLSIPPSRWAIAARSFGKGVRSSEAMGLKKGAYKALKRELTQHPAYKDMIAAGWIPMTSDSGELTAQTELFGSRFAGKIPWAKYSEQAYKMNLDFLALSTFELYKKGIDKSSRDLRERHEGYKAAVDWINVSSGRGSYSGRFGKWYKEKPAPFLNVIGWAPGLVYSRMQLLNPVTYAKNLKNPQSRVVFRKQMSELFQSGAVLFLIGAMAKAGGALISTDPDEADFLKIRFGTTRYDVLAGLQQVARLGIRMGEWARTRATEDGSDEASQKKLKKSANETTSAMLRFGRTKLGPVPGFFIDWLNDWKKVTGERHAPGDFIGDFKEGENLRGIAEMTEDPIVSQVIPLFWADMVQAYEQGWRANGQEGGLTHAAKMLPSGLGLGVQDYDRPEWSPRTKLHLDAFDLDPRFPTRKTGEREGDYQKRVRSHMAEQEKAIEQFADDPNLIGQPLERKKTLLKQEMSDEGRERLKKIAPEDVADDRMVRAWIQIGVDRLKANPVYQQMSEMEQKHALQSYYGRMNRYKAQPANGQHEYLRPDTVDENVLQEKIKAAISSQQDN